MLLTARPYLRRPHRLSQFRRNLDTPNRRAGGLIDAGFIRREVLDDVVADDLDVALTGLTSRLGAEIGAKLCG